MLGAVLTIAASREGTARRGAALCTPSALDSPSYSWARCPEGHRAFDALKSNYRWIAAVSGGILVGIGVRLVTEWWARIMLRL